MSNIEYYKNIVNNYNDTDNTPEDIYDDNNTKNNNDITRAELYVSCAYEDENVREIINELIDVAGLDDGTDGIIRMFSRHNIPYNIEIYKRFRNGTGVVDHYKFDRSEIINNE